MNKILSMLILFLSYLPGSISQNIGIGTTTPTRAKFEVNGAVDATSAIFGGEHTGISLQRNWPGIGFNTYYNGGNRYMYFGYAAKLYLDPDAGYLLLDMLPSGPTDLIAGNGNRALTIYQNGNVGLGGAPPNAPLQLANTLANRKIVLWETANNNHQFFGFGIESGTMRYSVAGTDNVHRFYCGTGPATSKLLMSIWGDRTVIIGDDGGGGKLGININAPTHTLTVRQAGGTGILIMEPAFGTNWHFQATSFQATSNHLNLWHQASLVGQFRMTGEYVWGSDARLKTNVRPMPGLLDKVMKLKPVVYEMIKHNPSHEKSLGFIAQQVKPLFPELVYVDDNPASENGIENLHTMNYSGFGVVAIKAIQEQQQMITDLQKRMAALEEQNKILLQLLNKKE